MNVRNLKFVEGIVGKHNDVTEVELIEPNSLIISTKDHPPANVLVIFEKRISAAKIGKLLEEHPERDFLCNIPTDCVWEGDALNLIAEIGIGWGGIRDLMAAIADGDTNGAQPKEYRFAERILSQHKNINHLERLYDRAFLAERSSGSELRIVILSEYELTADHVRTAWDTYGPLDIIYKTNPNGKPTKSAYDAAKALGIEVLDTKEIMKRLHS